MDLLLHICCAPCSTATVEAWRQDGVRLTGVYFNPNIQPLGEHRRRYDTLLAYASKIRLPLIGEPEYDVTAWLRMVAGNDTGPARCRLCIRQRLEHTAQLAAATGMSGFSTSLLVSPYQQHEIIREEGERAGREAGVGFAYRDLRPAYRRSVELARAAGLYRQKYCGCIYSEAEAAAKPRRAKPASSGRT